MSPKRKLRTCGELAAGVALLFVLAPSGMCQDESVQEAERESSDTIEEIIVYGNKLLSQLRLEVYLAQDTTFDLFNSMNSDDEFDIHCYEEAKIGSHVMERICRPNYVGKLTSQATRQWLLGQTGVYLHPVAEIQRKDELLVKEMEALVVDKPGLQKSAR